MMKIPLREINKLRRGIQQVSSSYGLALQRVPDWAWLPQYVNNPKPIEVWRSYKYLVQVYDEQARIVRLSICRAAIKPDGTWDDGLTWDELQRLKAECGRGDLDAVEVYPSGKDVVNVANMRHLWVFPTALPFKWVDGK